MTDNPILIVEDELIVATDLKHMLIQHGFSPIHVTSTGEKAIKIALEHKPSLLIVDIHLRDNIDGILAVETIKQKLDIPVIYLTAYSDTSVLRRAKKTKPFGYLLKPYKDIELLSLIESAFMHLEQTGKMKRTGELDILKKMLSHITPELAYVVLNHEYKSILHASENGRRILKDLDCPLDYTSIVGRFICFDDTGKIPLHTTITRTANVNNRHLNYTEIHEGADTSALVFGRMKESRTGSASIQSVTPGQENDDVMESTIFSHGVFKARENIIFSGQAFDLDLLFSSIRHEIKNVLNILKTTLAVFQKNIRTFDDEKIHSYFQRCNRAVSNMESILTQVTVNNYCQQVPFEKIQLLPFLHEILHQFSHVFSEHKITWAVIAHNNQISITTNTQALSQIFLNVLMNSIEAVQDVSNGHIKIIVSEADEKVEIDIIDNGDGLSEEDIERVFEPRFSTKNRGSGLGLTIVRDLLTLMKGSVTLFKKKDDLTVLRLMLPKSAD